MSLNTVYIEAEGQSKYHIINTLLEKSRGVFFGVGFIKQDGSDRKMNAQLSGDMKPQKENLILVKDNNAAKKDGDQGIRNINMDTLYELSIKGQKYKFTDVDEPKVQVKLNAPATPQKDKNGFFIGQEVIVTDSGCHIPHYRKCAQFMGLEKEWEESTSIAITNALLHTKGKAVIVKSGIPEGSLYGLLYMIRIGNVYKIIHSGGIKAA